MASGERQVRYVLDDRTRKLIDDRSWPRTGPGRFSPSKTVRRIVDRYATLVRYCRPQLSEPEWAELAPKVSIAFDSSALIHGLEEALRTDLEPVMDRERLEAFCSKVRGWSIVERVAAVDEIERRRLTASMPVTDETHPLRKGRSQRDEEKGDTSA